MTEHAHSWVGTITAGVECMWCDETPDSVIAALVYDRDLWKRKYEEHMRATHYN